MSPAPMTMDEKLKYLEEEKKNDRLAKNAHIQLEKKNPLCPLAGDYVAFKEGYYDDSTIEYYSSRYSLKPYYPNMYKLSFMWKNRVPYEDKCSVWLFPDDVIPAPLTPFYWETLDYNDLSGHVFHWYGAGDYVCLPSSSYCPMNVSRMKDAWWFQSKLYEVQPGLFRVVYHEGYHRRYKDPYFVPYGAGIVEGIGSFWINVPYRLSLNKLKPTRKVIRKGVYKYRRGNWRTWAPYKDHPSWSAEQKAAVKKGKWSFPSEFVWK
uniref:Uncharacterized protein n=1 Tax=Lingula anatina TaxID=7574 RepID=A0A0R7JP87_LINAN|nr:hypothetical protein [Lingula anatina]